MQISKTKSEAKTNLTNKRTGTKWKEARTKNTKNIKKHKEHKERKPLHEGSRGPDCAMALCVAKPLIYQIDQCQWPVQSSRSDWWRARLARLARLGRSHRSDDPNQDDLEDQEDFEQSELQYFEHFEVEQLPWRIALKHRMAQKLALHTS